MRLVDDDLRRAAVERARDGRVHVLGEQAAKALVGRLALLHVEDVRDAGDALHVGRDEDSHQKSSARPRVNAIIVTNVR